jgi:hypothetical protein
MFTLSARRRFVNSCPYVPCRLSRRIGGPNGGRWGGAQDRFRLTDEGKELAAALSQQEYQSRQPGQPRLQHPQQARAGVPAGAAAAAAAAGGGVTGFCDLQDSGDEQPFEQLMRGSPAAAAAAPAFVGRGRRLGGTPAAAAAGGGGGTRARGGRQAGPTQADRVGLLMSWEDDWGADPATAMGAPIPGLNAAAAAAAAGAARRRSAAAAAAAGGEGGSAADGAPTTGTARRQLLPRVKASERLLPLCAADKSCDTCEALRDFTGGSLPQMMLANLSKVKQQHVRQVAGWMAAPEGGGHALSISDGPGADCGPAFRVCALGFQGNQP